MTKPNGNGNGNGKHQIQPAILVVTVVFLFIVAGFFVTRFIERLEADNQAVRREFSAQQEKLVAEAATLRRDLTAQQLLITSERARVDAMSVQNATILGLLERVEVQTRDITARLIKMEVADGYRLEKKTR